MKRVAYTGITATALSLFLSQAAFASGWIVVDPMFTPHVPMVPVHPVTPIHPLPPVTPNPPHHTLHGNVSFGLHLQSEEVKVDINGPVARTYITQTFQNDTDQNLAGTYLFPLPEDTTFSSFSLQIDGKPVEGKILEAQEARQQYETIVRQLVDPGLLEYADYKTVRARVFPIPAHGTKKIELEYTQALKAEGGLFKYRFPLKADQNADPADSIKINVKLASNQSLRTIWSPTYTISSTRDNDHKATATYEGTNVLPDKDFLLYYSVSDKDMVADMLAQKRSDENGYFILSLTPPVEAKAVQSKDIVLVADTSGSMSGEKMEQCKKALKFVIDALNPGDHFGVVQFNTDVEPFKSQLVEATAENKKLAEKFVDELEARGGTNIGEALTTGIKMLSANTERPAYLVMMTDGEPTVGETEEAKLIKGTDTTRDIRLFDFGVGYDVNTRLLNKLAENHHGAAQYVEPNESLETALSAFYQKVKSPVMSNVAIAYDGIEVKDVYPREVKDIFAGTQVLLIGKYKNAADAKVKITGNIDGKQKEYVFPVKFPEEESGHSYLPRLWAMRRIGYLTDVAQANHENREVIDEIVSLSKKYGIISQYTSFLVTDPSEQRQNGMPVPVGAFRRLDRGLMPMAPGSSTPVRGRLEAKSRGLHSVAPAAAPAPMRSGSGGGGGGAADKDMIYGDEGSSGAFDALTSSETTGRTAILASKMAGMLRNKEDLDTHQSRNAAIKNVEDKTFYLVDGFWTDSDFDTKKEKPELVEFGSKQYFDLIAADPELRKYFAAGTQVIVNYKGHCYKVVQPASASG